MNATRTEEDFAENIDAIVAIVPTAQWVFVCDNLNTHLSATLVMLVAILCSIPLLGLGKKRKEGILKYQKKRRVFWKMRVIGYDLFIHRSIVLG